MDQGRAAAWPVVVGLTDLQPLGRGGFGTVYRAWQVSVGRAVALKVDSRVLVDERDQRRFMREASTAGRLSGHANIVSVYDAGLTPEGRPYLVMELCPGGSLAERIHSAGPLQPEEVRRIGVGIADALASAHAAGVLHRDVKPGNILIDAYGTAKLADFGLAAVLDASGDSSATREALTPAFASPEVRPEPADGAGGRVRARRHPLRVARRSSAEGAGVAARLDGGADGGAARAGARSPASPRHCTPCSSRRWRPSVATARRMLPPCATR